MEKKNVYAKLALARARFEASAIKKTGNAGRFKFFELVDIVPIVNRLASDIGFVCVVTFSAEKAALDFVDTEDGAAIRFESPMSTASLSGCHPVQNLGAVHTYMRRYLYLIAFDIIEPDAIDGGAPALPPKPQPEKRQAPAPAASPDPWAEVKELLEHTALVPVKDSVAARSRAMYKADSSAENGHACVIYLKEQIAALKGEPTLDIF